jgi:transcriptional regulator PpsR
LLAQPDVTLILDTDAVIRDVTVSNTISDEFVQDWLGRPWIETVADSGVERTRRSLEDARTNGLSAFRQIPQRFPSGLELPIEYTLVRLGGETGLIAIGRNLQASSELQSRLIAAQQAMERDYWKLREVETRYRLLFDASNEAVLVINAEDLRVVEANPAAIRALGLTRGWEFLSELDPRERDAFRGMLMRVRENGRAPEGIFRIGAQQKPWMLRASLMTDEASSVYMLQLVSVEVETRVISPPEPVGLANIIQNIPDGFVAIDSDGVVRSANRAFVDLVQGESEASVIGRPFDRWLHRSKEDLSALLASVRREGVVRLFVTSLRGERGAVAAVEISAGGDGEERPATIGMIVREVSPRLGAPVQTSAVHASAAPALPSLESAGKTPLKELVQAAISVVERHYVESALRITDGNRTAAAEQLGLSRQSLYAKLNRYGLEGGSDGKS